MLIDCVVLGASLGTLSAGRVGIGNIATANLVKAITIGIRYSAVRRQFGPEDSDEEFPVIEYQLQVNHIFIDIAIIMEYSQLTGLNKSLVVNPFSQTLGSNGGCFHTWPLLTFFFTLAKL